MNQGNQTCSFCSKSKDEVNRLILGPSIQICNECVATCDTLLQGETVSGWAMSTKGRCRFCGRSTDNVDHLIEQQKQDATICNHCFELCVDVLKKE